MSSYPGIAGESHTFKKEARSSTQIVNGALVRAHIYVAILGLLIPLFVALILSVKFFMPEFMGSSPYLTFGRLRIFHTLGAIFGWISVSFVGILYYCIPKLARRPLLSEPLAWLSLVLYGLTLTVGLVTVILGDIQGIEYAEFEWYIDIPFALSFVLITINMLGTLLLGAQKNLYVTSWYFILGFVFTALNFVMANILPAYFIPGAAGAALTGLWIHNAVGLWITPIGVGIMYYFLPANLKKPIYSHYLSLVGFWTLAFFYPLGGSHHYFFSPVPRPIQMLAVPLTFTLFIVVVTVVWNWVATLQGRWKDVQNNISLRFLVMGFFGYMLTCTQGPFQTPLAVQQITHFTDWVVAHAHIPMIGVFSMWIIGAFYYVWPRVTGKQLYSHALSEWSFWLITIGFYGLYFLPVTLSGILQGHLWEIGAPFIESVRGSKPYWIARGFGGTAIYIGFLCMALNLVLTATRPAKVFSAENLPEGVPA